MRTALATIVAMACSSSPAPPKPPSPPLGDAADAAIDVRVDMAPDARVATRVDAGVTAPPAARTCAAKPNPAACPATEPNINALCKKWKLECAYGVDCCKPVYVCAKQRDRQLRFEAHFRGCE